MVFTEEVGAEQKKDNEEVAWWKTARTESVPVVPSAPPPSQSFYQYYNTGAYQSAPPGHAEAWTSPQPPGPPPGYYAHWAHAPPMAPTSGWPEQYHTGYGMPSPHPVPPPGTAYPSAPPGTAYPSAPPGTAYPSAPSPLDATAYPVDATAYPVDQPTLASVAAVSAPSMVVMEPQRIYTKSELKQLKKQAKRQRHTSPQLVVDGTTELELVETRQQKKRRVRKKRVKRAKKVGKYVLIGAVVLVTVPLILLAGGAM